MKTNKKKLCVIAFLNFFPKKWYLVKKKLAWTVLNVLAHCELLLPRWVLVRGHQVGSWGREGWSLCIKELYAEWT